MCWGPDTFDIARYVNSILFILKTIFSEHIYILSPIWVGLCRRPTVYSDQSVRPSIWGHLSISYLYFLWPNLAQTSSTCLLVCTELEPSFHICRYKVKFIAEYNVKIPCPDHIFSPLSLIWLILHLKCLWQRMYSVSWSYMYMCIRPRKKPLLSIYTLYSL